MTPSTAPRSTTPAPADRARSAGPTGARAAHHALHRAIRAIRAVYETHPGTGARRAAVASLLTAITTVQARQRAGKDDDKAVRARQRLMRRAFSAFTLVVGERRRW